MIREIVQIEVKLELIAEFEAGVAKAELLFARARGWRSMSLGRSHETANRYWLIIHWDTVENHTVDFRESDDFQAWRSLVGHCFAAPPVVEHAREVWRLSPA